MRSIFTDSRLFKIHFKFKIIFIKGLKYEIDCLQNL